MNERKRLSEQVKEDLHRLKKAEKERPTLLAQTIYLGTIGLMLVLPIVIGAYLGSWLDEQLKGYSVSWTLSLILIGLMIGALNVYFLIRSHE